MQQALAKKQDRGGTGSLRTHRSVDASWSREVQCRRKPSDHRCEGLQEGPPGARSVQAEDSAEKRRPGVACPAGAAEKSWYPRSGLARVDARPGRQDPRPSLLAGHLGKLLHLPSLNRVLSIEVGTLMPTLWEWRGINGADEATLVWSSRMWVLVSDQVRGSREGVVTVTLQPLSLYCIALSVDDRLGNLDCLGQAPC